MIWTSYLSTLFNWWQFWGSQGFTASFGQFYILPKAKLSTWKHTVSSQFLSSWLLLHHNWNISFIGFETMAPKFLFKSSFLTYDIFGVLSYINKTIPRIPKHFTWWNILMSNLQSVSYYFDTFLFYQIFLSAQVKWWVIITYKHGIYELPHKLLNDLRRRMLGN